jgi:hypothetical protein
MDMLATDANASGSTGTHCSLLLVALKDSSSLKDRVEVAKTPTRTIKTTPGMIPTRQNTNGRLGKIGNTGSVLAKTSAHRDMRAFQKKNDPVSKTASADINASRLASGGSTTRGPVLRVIKGASSPILSSKRDGPVYLVVSTDAEVLLSAASRRLRETGSSIPIIHEGNPILAG